MFKQEIYPIESTRETSIWSITNAALRPAIRFRHTTNELSDWPSQCNSLSSFLAVSSDQAIIRAYILKHRLTVDKISSPSQPSERCVTVYTFGFEMPFVDTRLLGLTTYLILLSSGSLSDGETLVNRSIDCMTARKQCIKDFTNCGIYLFRVFSGKRPCSKHLGYDFENEQITGPADKICPTFCSLAIYNLTSRPKGKLLQSCECVNRDSICLTLKARMAKCVDLAVNGPRNDTKPGCTEIRKLCSKNQQCDAAQQFLLRKCSRLISGVECSKDCKRAQKRLLSLPLGNGLNECECDGYEEPHCRGIRAHQQALCFESRITKSVTPKDRPTQNVQQVESGSSESRRHLSRRSICTILTAIVFLGVTSWEPY